MNRRTILSALGGIGLLNSVGFASAHDDTDSDTAQTQDCDDPACGEAICPFDNSVKIQTERDPKEPIDFYLKVTGQIQLPDGRRVKECEGTVNNEAGGAYHKQFSYSGELVCVGVYGPGGAIIDQPTPCKPESNETTTTGE